MAEVPKMQEYLFGGSPEKQVPTLLFCTELLRNNNTFVLFVCFVVKVF
jgi:hypothetical protein